MLSSRNVAGVPKGSGVYAICSAPPGIRRRKQASSNAFWPRLYAPLYIGVSKNLKRRFLEHCGSDDPNIAAVKRCYGAGLEFYFVRLEIGKAWKVEALLLRCLRPPANIAPRAFTATLGDPIDA